MNKIKAIALAGVGLLASIILISSSPAWAATTTPASSAPGQALEIAPPLLTLNANPGQTITAQLRIQDISTGSLIVTNQINDFVAAGQGGAPKILFGNDTSDPFTIRQWITPLPSFELAPQKIETLNIAIHVPANAAPGGHYGVIRFTGTPPSLKSSGVSLSASLGALILLTVSGKLTDNLALSQFTVSSGTSGSGSIFESTPLNFIVKTKNNGNVQEQPTGHVIVTNMFNHSVAEVNVNSPPYNVLPDSTRQFLGPLNSTELGNRHLFGLYHAKLVLTYGVTTHKTLTDTLTFWVIPYKLIIIIIIVIIVLFFILRYLLRRYNRLIIEKARGPSPPPVTRRKR